MKKTMILMMILFLISSCSKNDSIRFVLNQSGIENPVDENGSTEWVRNDKGIYVYKHLCVDYRKIDVFVSSTGNVNTSIDYHVNEDEIQIYTTFFNGDNFEFSDNVLINTTVIIESIK